MDVIGAVPCACPQYKQRKKSKFRALRATTRDRPYKRQNVDSGDFSILMTEVTHSCK